MLLKQPTCIFNSMRRHLHLYLHIIEYIARANYSTYPRQQRGAVGVVLFVLRLLVVAVGHCIVSYLVETKDTELIGQQLAPTRSKVNRDTDVPVFKQCRGFGCWYDRGEQRQRQQHVLVFSQCQISAVYGGKWNFPEMHVVPPLEPYFC